MKPPARSMSMPKWETRRPAPFQRLRTFTIAPRVMLMKRMIMRSSPPGRITGIPKIFSEKTKE